MRSSCRRFATSSRDAWARSRGRRKSGSCETSPPTSRMVRTRRCGLALDSLVMKALVDAAVYSMVDDSAPPAEAILIDAGRIVAIGRTSDVIARGGPACEVVDARGQAIF